MEVTGQVTYRNMKNGRELKRKAGNGMEKEKQEKEKGRK